jgi:hypothetical protein
MFFDLGIRIYILISSSASLPDMQSWDMVGWNFVVFSSQKAHGAGNETASDCPLIAGISQGAGMLLSNLQTKSPPIGNSSPM